MKKKILRTGLNTKLSTLSLSMLMAGLFIPPVIAQEQEVVLDGTELILEEIIVTARKRDELLSDIPIAVTALSSSEIEAAGFESIKDLAKATAGFVFEGYDTNPGRFDSVPFIRGVTFDNPSPIRQPVSVFIDGVYVVGGTSGIGVEDVERIEIIKGPQSAQFGRATFAGAINYITADPSEEFSGKIGLTAASRGEYELTGLVEGKLFEGLTARLSGRFADKEGHYDNALDTSQRFGDEETSSVGLTLQYAPNDAFQFRVRGFSAQLDDGVAASVILNETFNTLQPGGIRPYLVGDIPSVSDALIAQNTTNADFQTWIADARSIGLQYVGDEPERFGLVSDTSRLSADFSYDFGSVVLTGNFGTNSQEATFLGDQDQGGRRTFTFLNGRKFEDDSVELQLSGSALNDRLEWAIGASQLDIDFEADGAFGFQSVGQSASFGARGSRNASTLEVISTDAIFGQIGYAFNDKFRANFEFRDQDDTIDVREQGNSSVTERKGEFSNFLPRVTLDFKPNEDNLLYVSYSEGNLPGNFNNNFVRLSASQQAEARSQFPGATDTVDEETLESIEIGWKRTMLDGRANVSVALYNMERVDQVSTALIQVTNPDFDSTDPASTPFQTTTLEVNAAATDISGLEIEGNFIPNNYWSLRSTLAFIEAEVSAFPDSGNAGDYNLAFGNSNGFIGTTAPRYPEIQGSMSATYSAPASLFGSESWYVRGDLFYQDDFFLSTANLGTAPASTEINLRAGLVGAKWSLEAFITNLTDEDAPVAANNTSTLTVAPGFAFTDTTSVGLRDKRQIGIRASYKF